MRSFILFCFIKILLVASNAYSSEAYCNNEGKFQQIYFAPRLELSDEEQKRYLSVFEKTFLSLEVGDKIEIFSANDNGVLKTFSLCFPGCPPQGFVEQIFGVGGECKPTRAKAEKIKFVNKFKRTVYDLTLNAKNGNEGVTNLLGTLSAINLHQRAQEQSFNLSETRIISTMFDAENPSLDDLNNYFVTEIQRSELPDSFPDAIIAGMPIDTDVIDLWKDIYSINGQEFRYEVN